MVAGLDFAFVPVSLARPIPHDDSLRSQFYAVRNITISNRENMDRLRYRMTHEWLPQSHRDPAGAAPLWYRPPATLSIRTAPNTPDHERSLDEPVRRRAKCVAGSRRAAEANNEPWRPSSVVCV